jgi:subtilisin family serine protease
MAKYVISYDKNVDLSTLQSSLTTSGCTINDVLTSLGVILLESSDTEFTTVSGVLTYELDSEITVTEQWHLNRICSQQLPMRQVYVSKNKGAGSTVYLVDSGVNTTHDEMCNANVQNLWSWDENFVDTSGHGTALASLIVGKILGVSPEATLKNVKIPMGQSIPISVLLNAFNAILSDHQLTSGIKVVNCSWNIPKSLILDSKIKELQDHGLVVVAAAGNDMIDANTLSPVGLNTVLGVAASDSYDRAISWGTNAGSNWGPDVDITAPGIDVPVLTVNGEIQNRSGTSIAAAVVSGAVCQFIVDNPSVSSASDIQDIILTSAKHDILFRNENIYGTTPNRLIFIPFAELISSPSRENRIIKIQKGTTITIPVELVPPAVSIKVYDFVRGTKRRTTPEWVTLENSTATISPSITTESGNYVLEMDILDENHISIGYSQIIVKVYDISIEELSEDETYIYHTINEDDTVVVLRSYCASFCTGNATCNAIGGKSCNCLSYGCTQT